MPMTFSPQCNCEECEQSRRPLETPAAPAVLAQVASALTGGPLPSLSRVILADVLNYVTLTPDSCTAELDLADEWRTWASMSARALSGPYSTVPNPCAECDHPRVPYWMAQRNERAMFARYISDVFGTEIAWCEECELPADTDTVQETVDGYTICEDCPSYTCEDCLESYRYTNTVGDSEVCRDCLNSYSHCEECDTFYNAEYDESHESCGQCPCPPRDRTFSVPLTGSTLAQNVIADLALPSGTIDDSGLADIRYALYAAGLHSARYVIDSVGDEWQTTRGNYTKRLSAAAYKYDGTKIPADVLAKIGTIARNASSGESAYRVSVSRDLNDSAESWGHGSSCLWGSYSSGRCAMKANGALGLRTWDKWDDVSGRAWVLPMVEDSDGRLTAIGDAPISDAIAWGVFNGYGDLDGAPMVRVWSHMVSLPYAKVPFSTSPIYMNSDKAYLVAASDVLARHASVSMYLKGCGHR